MQLLEKISTSIKSLSGHNFAPASRYERLWRFTIIITTMISFVPLIFMVIVNYYQDQKSYSAEMHYRINQILDNTKRTLEFIIEERQSVLMLLVKDKNYDEMIKDDCLAITLKNLKNSFGGFVDLGIIDSDGNQIKYVGPYELQGKNYRDQTWFHEVSLRGVYVSDVFMGYRNFPHFVITVKADKFNGGFFVLRATIDMELINRQINALNLDEDSDVFIVNSDGILQTASKFRGEVLSNSGIEISPRPQGRIMISEHHSGGKWENFGYTDIKGAPFYVYACTQLENPFKHWAYKRSELLWILGITMLVIFIFIVYRSTYMVNRLRISDERHAKTLHNMEYTSKMATIGRMAASVAHEINNPLAIINEKAGLLKDIVSHTDEFPKKDKSYALLTSIESSVDRCSNVTHRLLGFSRRMDIHKELIDLEILMKEVVGFIGKEAEHKNIDIVYNIDDEISSIESDRGQLQQVFLNIINNSIAAIKEKGVITISIKQPNIDFITVSIEDTGTGISADNLKHIFEPFFSTKGQFGTGLGLSITKEIVERIGGTIEVKSTIGQGTIFTINLPVHSIGVD